MVRGAAAGVWSDIGISSDGARGCSPIDMFLRRQLRQWSRAAPRAVVCLSAAMSGPKVALKARKGMEGSAGSSVLRKHASGKDSYEMTLGISVLNFLNVLIRPWTWWTFHRGRIVRSLVNQTLCSVTDSVVRLWRLKVRIMA